MTGSLGVGLVFGSGFTITSIGGDVLDYTYDGVPVSKVPTEDICRLLREGFEINDDGGLGEAKASDCVRKRLEIELVIRATRV